MVTVTGYCTPPPAWPHLLNAGGTRRLLRRFGLAVSAGYLLGVALLLGIICFKRASETLAAARAFDLVSEVVRGRTPSSRCGSPLMPPGASR